MSERTIRRDLEVLQASHFPVHRLPIGIGEDDDGDYDDPDPEEDLQGLNFMRVEFGR